MVRSQLESPRGRCYAVFCYLPSASPWLCFVNLHVTSQSTPYTCTRPARKGARPEPAKLRQIGHARLRLECTRPEGTCLYLSISCACTQQPMYSVPSSSPPALGNRPHPAMAAARLLSWFKDNGGTLHQAVEIAYNNHDGYHLRTTADLDSTVPLLHCPRTVTLSVQDAEAESEWPSAFLFRFRRSSPEVLIRFQLMYEHSKGSTSKWWPYLATLPPPQQDPDASLFNTPLWFSESDRLWLRGTNLEAAIADRENAWRKELHEGLSLLRGATDVTPYTWSEHGRLASHRGALTSLGSCTGGLPPSSLLVAFPSGLDSLR